ncbi:unnamed protein product [Macrosiphum euphorbiae]|uniref:Uncharacterized protein n=1 Tax=Macrosiphum euphorbiae TaxID=13131 RepID=A0AAV0X909_9HEMI|nr:unnamed protein product [Macrosiphum euphorbiae]
MPLGANSGGDAPEVRLTVSKDSPCAVSSVATLMTLAAAAVENSLLEQQLSDGLELVATDTVTCGDEGTEPAIKKVTPRRPRSLWDRTKKVLRQIFCCCAVGQADD